MTDCYALALRLRPAVQRLRTGLWEPTLGAAVSGGLTAPLACIPPRERRHARGSPPAAPLLHPGGDRLPVGPASRHSCAAWRQTSEAPSRIPVTGQQVSAPDGEIAYRSHRGIVLGSREFSPPHMMHRLAVQLRYDVRSASRTLVRHAFECRGMSPRLAARGRTFAVALVMSSRPA